jgi:hypothetical protein
MKGKKSALDLSGKMEQLKLAVCLNALMPKVALPGNA